MLDTSPYHKGRQGEGRTTSPYHKGRHKQDLRTALCQKERKAWRAELTGEAGATFPHKKTDGMTRPPFA